MNISEHNGGFEILNSLTPKTDPAKVEAPQSKLREDERVAWEEWHRIDNDAFFHDVWEFDAY